MADRERMLAALNEGAFPDPAGAARFLTEDAEWLTLTPPGPHRGTGEMGKVWAHWLETADSYSLRLEQATPVCDHVVLELIATLQGTGSEIEIEQRFYSVFSFREGRIARMEDFVDRGRAFARAEAE